MAGRTGPEERPTVRKIQVLGVFAALAALCAGCGSSGNGPVTLNWYVFPEPSGSFQAAANACSNRFAGRKYKIAINFLSTASDQQRVSLVRRLAANDSSIDILAMDVDWTAEFANAKWIQPVPGSARRPDQIRRPGRARPDRHLQEPALGGPDQLEHRAAVVPQGPAGGHPPARPTTWTQMISDADPTREARQAALHRGAGRPVRGPDGVVQLAGRLGRRPDHHRPKQGRDRAARRRSRRRSCTSSPPRRPPTRR